jgi:hypothetical protein
MAHQFTVPVVTEVTPGAAKPSGSPRPGGGKPER